MPKPIRALAVACALVLVAACGTLGQSNPLIGRWTLTAPVGTGFALGTYEFRPSSMEVLGLEQQVGYAVSDDVVTVIPQGFGPTLEIEMIDRDMARLRDPLTGGLLTLRRLD